MARAYAASEDEYRQAILDAVGTVAPVGVLLDVGCDDGTWTAEIVGALRSEPDRVVGVEMVEERAGLARGRGVDAFVADLEHPWPVASESVDLLHANQVIEHVKRLDHFVGEVARVLRRGGRAVVCTENLASWPNVIASAAGFMPFSLTNVSSHGPVGNPLALHGDEPFDRPESWQHVHVLTLRALRSIFELHGLVVDGVFGGGYLPLWGRPSGALCRRDPWHAHFVGVVANKARTMA